MTSYDDLWRSSWGNLQCCGPVHRHLREDLVRLVRSLGAKTVLDVVCGSGDNLAALAEIGDLDLAGVDVSSEALALAQRRVPGARLALLDAQHDMLAEKFDLVMSLQVVEHLLDDIAALRNMARMARSWVFVSTLKGRMRQSELAIGHVRNYGSVELRQKCEVSGLQVVRMSGWGFPFYSPMYRTVSEWLPGGPPTDPSGPVGRLAAWTLYQLYRLNWPGRGDVLSVLARPVEAP